ncbi:MAG: AAA family ATPase [Deltaproteobacteria bacterium]|nr:AAA family ATPase [Deltaproteobacteria bacterium]
MPIGINSFNNVRENNYVCGEKTQYLARIISSCRPGFFFSRPRCYGKSLTISTLHSLFSGDRDIFKGLAIEKHFNLTILPKLRL